MTGLIHTTISNNIDLLPHLRREGYVMKAASQFGVFLSSVPNQDPHDISSWGFVVATPDLRCVPRSVIFSAGAMEYTVKLVPRRWISGQVYGALDFPKLPEKIVPPSARSPVLDFSGDSLTIKLHDLKKIFRHVSSKDIPVDLRLAMAEQQAEKTDPKGKRVITEDAVVQLLRRDLSVVSSASEGAHAINKKAGTSSTSRTHQYSKEHGGGGKQARTAANGEATENRSAPHSSDQVRQGPHKIAKRGREAQDPGQCDMQVSTAAKRTIRPVDRAAQVLTPSSLSISIEVGLNKTDANVLFPEIEGSGEEPVNLLNPNEKSFNAPLVPGLNTVGAHIEVGRVEQTGVSTHEQLNKDSGLEIMSEAGPSGSNAHVESTQDDVNVNCIKTNAVHKTKRGRPKGKGSQQGDKDVTNKIAVVDESEFISVPLLYHESLDMAALIGVQANDVNMLANNEGATETITSRVRSRVANKSDVINIPSPVKDKGSNVTFIQQVKVKGKRLHKERRKENVGACEDDDALGSPTGRIRFSSEEELDYGSE